MRCRRLGILAFVWSGIALNAHAESPKKKPDPNACSSFTGIWHLVKCEGPDAKNFQKRFNFIQKDCHVLEMDRMDFKLDDTIRTLPGMENAPASIGEMNYRGRWVGKSTTARNRLLFEILGKVDGKKWKRPFLFTEDKPGVKRLEIKYTKYEGDKENTVADCVFALPDEKKSEK